MESDSASIVKIYIHGYIQISSLTNNIVQAYINYPFLSRERERERGNRGHISDSTWEFPG